MSQKNEEFRIEWDLHELGERPAPRLQAVPQDRAHIPRELLARALASGEVPANAPQLLDEDEEKAA
jgi:hypothetical protein